MLARTYRSARRHISEDSKLQVTAMKTDDLKLSVGSPPPTTVGRVLVQPQVANINSFTVY